jgi:putative copper resistance protein D
VTLYGMQRMLAIIDEKYLRMEFRELAQCAKACFIRMDARELAALYAPPQQVHLVHAVAAAVWLGALAALTILLRRRAAQDDLAIHRALHGFSGLGTIAVGLLVLTGLVNSWFLVGPQRVADLGANLYGQLLIAKLLLFAVMVALAAGNRFRLTPGLGKVLASGEDPLQAFQRLRRSVVAETLVGAVLLAVVAVMGTLAPPSAL